MGIEITINEEQAISRIAVEYIEMPDLKLTLDQARRLLQIPEPVCRGALASLVARGFLVQTRTGAFLRRAAGVSLRIAQAS